MQKSFVKKPISVLLSLMMLLSAWVFVAPAAQALSVGDTIQFGTYPQTQVTDETLIAALDAAPKTWASYGYYTGTGSMYDGQMQAGDCMRFADFFYGGKKYRAVIIDSYRPKQTSSHSTEANSNQPLYGFSTATAYYFEYEPLTWRVLDPSTGFIMCERIIDSQAFQNTIYKKEDNDYYQSADSSAYASDYATSSIRDWLNMDFYQTAFTEAQRTKIKTTALNNNAVSSSTNYASHDSAATNDKVFLLSYAEVINTAYGFSSDRVAKDENRKATWTNYAVSQGLSCQRSGDWAGYTSWWLRTPGTSWVAWEVAYTGQVTNAIVLYTYYGVRPACKISTLVTDLNEAPALYSHTKAGHTVRTAITENSVAATCTTAGSYDSVVYCSCGTELSRTAVSVPVDSSNHSYGAPTYSWTQSGSTWKCTATRTCSRDTSHKETETVNATGSVTTQPTCTAQGKTTYTATFTNAAFSTQTKVVTDVPANGHSYGTPTYSWTQSGSTWKCTATRTCSRDTSHKETETVNATGSVTTQPTCTAQGQTTYTATFTNAAFATQTKIVTDVPANGHAYVNHEAKEPTCTEIGWNAYRTCENCDYTEYVELPANGHAYVNHDAQVPTCTEIGWAAYQTCENCDYTTYVEIPANGHAYVNHEAKEPTCTEIGWDAYRTCENCDYTEYVELPANGHVYVNHDAQAPTCTEIGWEAYRTCENCDYTEYVELPATGHAYVNHDAQAPTCTEIGWDAYRTCENCDYTEYVELPANGHAYVNHDAKAPTCTEIGWEAYRTCENCDYTEYVEIPANGHAYVNHDAQAPTCTEIGWEAYRTCENCDYTEYVEIPASGHTYVSHDAQAPTCTEIGWEAYRTCENCDYTEYVEIPANGHAYVNHDAQAPTCTEIGWAAYQTCENCDYTTYVEIPATGDHIYGTTGAARYTCTSCGTVDAERKAAAVVADNQAAAAVVIALIDAIGEVKDTDASKAKIDAARDAYDKLTDEQKALVTNKATLEQAEASYTALTEKPCKYCGEIHDSSIGGGLTAILHALFYFILHIIGKR